MKKLLIPTDFSEHAEQGVKYAMDLARFTGAEVLLFHAFYDPMLDSDLPTYQSATMGGGTREVVLNDIEEESRRLLAEKKREWELKMGPNLPITTLLERGFADQLIPEVALREGCSMIVMSSRGKSKVYKTFFGSVTADVMQNARMPVLVVPKGTNFMPIQHVMYASDFDPADGVVLRQLMHLLKPLNFDLCTVYVFNDHGHPYRKEDYIGLRTAMRSHMQHVMPDAHMDILATGDSDLIEGLNRQLENRKTDLLVMTTHARNFIHRLMHPSATKRMLFNAKVPLLIFRVKE